MPFLDHVPSLDEAKHMSTTEALIWYIQAAKLEASDFNSPEEYLAVLHAFEDKIMGKMFPVQQIGVIAH